MCVPIAENHWIMRSTIFPDNINSKPGFIFLTYCDGLRVHSQRIIVFRGNHSGGI
jgi:hypothetical protein